MEKKPKELKATYEGELKLGEALLYCAVLNDGTRVISQNSVFKAFGRPKRGVRSDGGKRELDGIQLPSFVDANNLKPFIPEDFRGVIRPVEYLDSNGREMTGFRAEVIPAVCEIYLSARSSKALKSNQLPLAEASEIIVRALSRVGIAALIDEATGYQFDRKYNALRVLLEQYIAEGLQKWTKRFPDKFFEELDRLYDNPKTTPRKRPQYYGKFINTYIYEPIENGYLKQELDKLNIKDDKKRKARFHQWLSDFGLNQLQLQIGRVLGVIEISPNLRKFKSSIERQSGLSLIQLDLFEDT